MAEQSIMVKRTEQNHERKMPRPIANAMSGNNPPRKPPRLPPHRLRIFIDHSSLWNCAVLRIVLLVIAERRKTPV